MLRLVYVSNAYIKLPLKIIFWGWNRAFFQILARIVLMANFCTKCNHCASSRHSIPVQPDAAHTLHQSLTSERKTCKENVSNFTIFIQPDQQHDAASRRFGFKITLWPNTDRSWRLMIANGKRSGALWSMPWGINSDPLKVYHRRLDWNALSSLR